MESRKISLEHCLSGWAAPSKILNPDAARDSVWAKALADGDEERARQAFVTDLRREPFLPAPEYAYIPLAERWSGIDFGHHGGHDYDPDDVVKQCYTGCYGIKHTFEDEIDWMFDPTAGWGDRQTAEWQVQFNRHYHWVVLARAWERTGDEKYAKAFERELLSWVTSQCPAPPRKDMRLPGTWRTIDAGIRAGWAWPLALEIFRKSHAVSDIALWLMVAAFREHGRYLFFSPTANNFKAMENLGLAHAGMLFSESFDSDVYAATAIDRAIAEMHRQFYPDGCQVELASSYGRLSMACTFCTLKLAENAGYNSSPHYPRMRGTQIHAWQWKQLLEMGKVYAKMATPDGTVPGMHDCDGISVERMFGDLVAFSGSEPNIVPPWRAETSVTHIPWGGYGILRREGRWSMLDAGPWGAAHQHSDALQVITWSDGGFWCIDPGKPTYDQSPETKLIRSSEGHNVVLMDGLRHLPDPMLFITDTALPMAVHQDDGVSVAAAARVACCDKNTGIGFRHERLLMDIPGIGWLVVDRTWATDSKPHHWETLWHFPETADITIQAAGATVHRKDGAHLHVTMAAAEAMELTTVKGAAESLRGWAVHKGVAKAHPIPVLIGKCTETVTPFVCATLFSHTLVAAEALSLRIQSDATTLDIADAIRITFTGRHEWQTVSLERSGGRCDLRLADHTFPLRSPKGKSES